MQSLSLSFSARCLTGVVSALLLAAPGLGQAGAPTPQKGYSLSVFAVGVAGKYTAPDSIAVYNNHI